MRKSTAFALTAALTTALTLLIAARVAVEPPPTEFAHKDGQNYANIFGCWRPVTDEQAAILDAGNFSGGGLYKFYWMHFTDEGWATRRGVCRRDPDMGTGAG